MSAWLRELWTVASIELRQRVRGVAWYILLGIYALLLLLVTVVASFAFQAIDGSGDEGDAIYAVIVFFTLLLATLVTPALAGNAINGDRSDGTLATTQVTLVTTTQLVLGKFVAAFISTLAFVVVAVPFFGYAVARGGLPAGTILSSLGVLLLEMAVIAAASVGFSGIIGRPILSVVVSYLLVAAMSVGTLIGFGLLGLTIRETVTYTTTDADWDRVNADQAAGIDPYQPGGKGVPKAEYCTPDSTYTSTSEVPRYDLVWWLLAPNPYVVLADATPTVYDADGQPKDLFGYLKLGIREAQRPLTELTGDRDYNACDPANYDSTPGESARHVIDSTVPSWFVGLALHLLTAAGLLWWAIARTRTPARKLPAGQRVA